MSRVARFMARASAEGFFRAAEGRILSRLMRVWPCGDFWDRHYAFMKFRLAERQKPGCFGTDAQRPTLQAENQRRTGEPSARVRYGQGVRKALREGDGRGRIQRSDHRCSAQPIGVRSFVFPDRCCIKATHGSGQTIIRKHGEAIDIDKIVSWFGYSHYHTNRERNYLRLTPKIIVEQLAFDADNADDYKFYCFHGEPKFIRVTLDRRTNCTGKVYGRDWKDTGCSIEYPTSTRDVPRPANLDHMLELARILSRPFSFMRVDLYTNGESILVGEGHNRLCPRASRLAKVSHPATRSGRRRPPYPLFVIAEITAVPSIDRHSSVSRCVPDRSITQGSFLGFCGLSGSGAVCFPPCLWRGSVAEWGDAEGGD